MKAKDYFMYILGALLSICFFAVIALLIFKPIPQENRDVFYLILGSLIGLESTVVNYFYGSSRGSAEKSELLKQ
jgi:predicted outer membrane lipoprotein